MHIHTMTKHDVSAGLRLNSLAGWNQTAADWHRFLDASPDGCFVAKIDDRVCGTATTISYQDRFAWIGMVLVDPDYRNCGVGTQLLRKTVEHLDQRGIPTMKLDATPQGQAIYAKMGFEVEYQIERWILKRTAKPANFHCPPLTEDELLSILARDRSVFGADRGHLLRSLHDETPKLTIGISQQSALQGYALGRRGAFADHLGPWVAENRATAEKLIDEFLTRSSRETVIADCLTGNPFAVELLRARQFVPVRPLTRMYRGLNAWPGYPDVLCAILGPEFG
jgi:ribosomal protein S18 acetylase RimI-like enzyme